MTVSSEVNRAGPYLGNGSTTVFGFGFRILSASHLRVIITDEDDVETDLPYPSGYSVTGVGANAGGSITISPAPATGYRITILRNVPMVQETDLENQGAYYAETIERQFDLVVMQNQQQSEELRRAVKVPAGDPDPDGALSSNLALGILRLYASADNIDAVANGADAIDTVAATIVQVQTVANGIAAVQTVAGSIGDVGTVAGDIANVRTVAGVSDDVSVIATNIDTLLGLSGSILSLLPLSLIGDGASASFNLPVNSTTSNVIVWLNKVRQTPVDDYQVADDVLTFASVPVSGDDIELLIVTAVTTESIQDLYDDFLGGVTIQKRNVITTAGQRRYAVDAAGAALSLRAATSAVFGASPFGMLTLGVDYTIDDGALLLSFDPADGELLHAVSFPRASNSEAQVILEELEDRVSGYADRAEDARDVAIAAQTPFASYADALAYVGVAPSVQIRISALIGGRLIEWVRQTGGPCLGGGWAPVGSMTPDHMGIARGADETAKITAMLDWATTNSRAVDWVSGEYVFDSYAFTGIGSVTWRASQGPVVLRSSKTTPAGPGYEDDNFVYFHATTIDTGTISTDLDAGGARVTLPSWAVSVIPPGPSLLSILSDRVIETDDRGQARVGWVVPIARVVSSTVVELDRAIPASVKASPAATGAVITAITPPSGGTSWSMTVASLIGRNVSDMRYRVTFDASGATALPSEFDPATGTFTFQRDYPAGLAVGSTISILRNISFFLSHALPVDIEGQISFEREAHVAATPGDLGFRGLTLSRAVRPKVKGLSFRNFSETALRIASCYAPDVSDITTSGSNRAYSGFGGTGYGVACHQSSWGKFSNIYGMGCRRTLDFGGTQMVSYHNEAENIHGYGGGTAYDGVRFWPIGTTQQSVVGSHGGAVGTVYTNSRGVNTYGIINLRGSNEKVSGVYGAGAIEHMVNIFYGDRATIDGLFYTDGRPDWMTSPALTSKYTIEGKLRDGVVVVSNSNPLRPISISNVILRGVTQSLLSLVGGGVHGPITIGGIVDIITDNEQGNQSTFWLIRATGSEVPNLSGPVNIGPVSIKSKPSAPKQFVYIINPAGFDIQSYVKLPSGAVIASVANNSAVTIPVATQDVARVSVYPYLRVGTWALIDAILWSNTLGDRSPVPVSSGVDLRITPLTGTTGADGAITVAYRPGGASTFQLENRSGASALVQIECSAFN